MIAVEFARFLGLPVTRQAEHHRRHRGRLRRLPRHQDQPASASTRSTTSTLATRAGAEASDTLKYFSERIPATFAYAGISVERSGLLSGTRGEQIAGRFSMVRTGPFPRDPQWTALIAALEDSLRLHRHRPGTLPGLDRLPAPAHRRHDRQPALADPLRRRPRRPRRHREDHQEIPRRHRHRPGLPASPRQHAGSQMSAGPACASEAWTAPPVGYCLQRRADDPHLRDTDLLEEITSLGYHERLASMANYLRRHAPPRQPCTQCGSPADRAIAAHRETCLLAPDGQLPVPVRPLAGEMLASYLGRLAAANHLPVTTLTAALPAWLTWKYASHRLLPAAPGRRRKPPRACAGSPSSPGRPRPRSPGPCPRSAAGPAARPRHHGLPAMRRRPRHHPAGPGAPGRSRDALHRHGIWLPPPGLPQLDVSACPEIITAQHRARRLLRRCTPEQLIYAQAEAAALATSGRTPDREPSPGWEKRALLLQKTTPGLNAPRNQS